MARLSIVVGFHENKATASPELVYLGRSGEAMRLAIEAATFPRLLVIPHATGIPKHNPRAAANAAAQAAVAAAHPAEQPAAAERPAPRVLLKR